MMPSLPYQMRVHLQPDLPNQTSPYSHRHWIPLGIFAFAAIAVGILSGTFLLMDGPDMSVTIVSSSLLLAATISVSMVFLAPRLLMSRRISALAHEKTDLERRIAAHPASVMQKGGARTLILDADAEIPHDIPTSLLKLVQRHREIDSELSRIKSG